ncbi:class I SAM-dependent methyltransferase [Caenimonas terrae]|uniref:Class I SAM-dependent methyltransferase n=1 Tax=Caenimonas terrae TaxID=696074 RepID=A0ABW0NJM2_9BURK
MTPPAAASSDDSRFAGSIPQLYERYMVPLIFEPYAADLGRQVAALRPGSVLELAAGTGVVTRHLAQQLAPEVSIVATDLNQPMLDVAAQVGTARPVRWQQADAMQLPFPDRSFDVVVCQFGVMFFPDKAKAFAQARRVLRPGGQLVFNVWDRIEENDMILTVCEALDRLFPDAPPRFMHRGPHGYADRNQIADDLARGGLSRRDIAVVAHRSRAPSPREPALAYCQGSPLRAEIEAQGPSALADATEAAIAALAGRFGPGPIEGRIQALVAIAQA